MEAAKVLIQRLRQSWIKQWQEGREQKVLVYNDRFRHAVLLGGGNNTILWRETGKASLLYLTQWPYSENLGEAIVNWIRDMCFWALAEGTRQRLSWCKLKSHRGFISCKCNWLKIYLMFFFIDLNCLKWKHRVWEMLRKQTQNTNLLLIRHYYNWWDIHIQDKEDKLLDSADIYRTVLSPIGVTHIILTSYKSRWHKSIY